MVVPGDVQRMLGCRAAVGATDDALPLLTVDDAGYPAVCLLSPAHCAADAERIYVVVAGTGARHNLQRDGRACLVVVADGGAHYCTLDVVRSVDGDGLTGYACTLRAHRYDVIPDVPLRGMTYDVTDAIPELERWEAAGRLIADLVAGSTG